MHKFVLNKLSKIDTDINYENAKDINVFKMSSYSNVDLNTFDVKVNYSGVDFRVHVKDNNFEENISKIIFHLKSHSKYPLEFEKLDDRVLGLINSV